MSPTFSEVPDHWKHPNGPYRKAPEDYGAEWWLVNPFTSAEPWKQRAPGTEADEESLPPGFAEIFGTRPQAADFLGTSNPSLLYRIARTQWEQDLRQFVRAGLPEWADRSQYDTAANLFRSWGMGTPSFYAGRYGWMVRFPGSQARDFEAAAWTALTAAHQVIAQYQLELIERGITPKQQHPFVPPHMWPKAEGSEEA